MLISRDAVRAYLGRDLDRFGWLKHEPRAEIERELRGMRVPPRFKTQPWGHQLVCFYLALLYPRFLFLLDMGLGKSKIFADTVTQLQRERRLDSALVCVPRKVNIASWMDDLAVHSDLEPWPILAEDIGEKWELLRAPRGQVTLIDYQGLQWALCDKKLDKRKSFKLTWNKRRIDELAKRYNVLNLDEIHMLSSHDNLWFRLVNQVSQRMEHVYGNTGTLIGKRVEDIWSQFYLVDRGETFGENLGLFRAAFFTEQNTGWRTEFVYNHDRDRDLNRLLGHRSIRYDEDEVSELDLPPLVPHEVKVDMNDEQRGHYLNALEGLINAGGSLRECEAAWIRMRQITSGYLAWNDDAGSHALSFKQNPKLDALQSIVEGARSKVVVSYEYTETGRRIVERLEAAGFPCVWFYGGTKDHVAARRKFIDDPKVRVFVMNSASGGTGTDGLQKVARYVVLYETPSDPRLRKQVIKRVARSGGEGRAFMYDLIARRSCDRGILDDIAEGLDTFAAVVNGRGRRDRGFFLRG